MQGEVENLTMRRGFIHRKGWEKRVSKVMMEEKSCWTMGSSKGKTEEFVRKGYNIPLGPKEIVGL